MRLLPVAALVSGMFILACAAPAGDTGGGGFLGIGDEPKDEPDPATDDSDGDGLTDQEEADLGTDPAEADSDDDGYDDPDEISGNTDPLDEDDHPYEGGWPIAACRNDTEGEGFSAGDVSEDFALDDQFGDSVQLYSFCDKEVYLVFAAFW